MKKIKKKEIYSIISEKKKRVPQDQDMHDKKGIISKILVGGFSQDPLKRKLNNYGHGVRLKHEYQTMNLYNE